MNVIIAFLYSLINQIIYVKLLHDYELLSKVALLNKALYGLKQSPHLWYKTLFDHLISLRFWHSELNHSIFLKNSIIITVYINDLLLIGSSKSAIQRVKNELNLAFNMTDLGLITYYLSMQIKQNCTECTIHLTQTVYIHKVLHTFCQNEANSVNISMNSDIVLMKKFNKQADVITICCYQWAINSLTYIMLQMCSDIVFAVFFVSQFTQNSNTTHYNAVKQIFRYLVETATQGVTYKFTESGLLSYTDADWGGDQDSRKSTDAYLFLLFRDPIS